MTAAKSFLLPDLGEGLHEAEIVEWHVKAGDEVKADAPLVSVETDKAVVEVPAPWSGRIAKLCAEAGETIAVGSPVVEYEGAAAVVAPTPAQATEAAPATKSAQVARVAASAPGTSRPRAMPAVRVLAQELGIELSALTGSGPQGAITAKDVAQAFKASVGASGLRAMPIAIAEPSEGFEPLKGARRSMAEAMSRAREVMPATVTDDVDIGGWAQGTRTLARLIRAACRAVAVEPAVNAWFDPSKGRRLSQAIDLGLAVDTPTGLIVPVIRNAGGLSTDALEREIARLIEAARARTLSPEELKGATFTLSNYGSIAGRHATPVVVPPQVAILGAGRVHKTVRLDGGTAVERPMLPLSLTIDHRAVTGGESARFLAAVMEDLAKAN
ncbi:MAG: dihydrolipoamide acetyltransferase family protein [Hyphomicrobiaceae bacterium]